MSKLLLISLFIINSSLAYAAEEVPFSVQNGDVITSFVFIVSNHKYSTDRESAIRPCIQATKGVEQSLLIVGTNIVLLDKDKLSEEFEVEAKNSWIVSRSATHIYDMISEYKGGITYSIDASTYKDETVINCIISSTKVK